LPEEAPTIAKMRRRTSAGAAGAAISADCAAMLMRSSRFISAELRSDTRRGGAHRLAAGRRGVYPPDKQQTRRYVPVRRRTMRPVVIAVAITGSVPRKRDNPAVPISTSEQIESTHEAFEAGASLVHIHVRNPDETPSSDPALFAQVMDGVKRHCPGMIVQFSTGGRGREASARGSALPLKPDMASLSTGSVNFPSIVYERAGADRGSRDENAGQRHPAGDRGVRPLMIHGARGLSDRGLIDEKPHMQFVLGVKNALPAREHLLEILLGELRRVLPKATWTAAGIGRHQAEVMEWALTRKANGVRTGLEDNIPVTRERLAKSNAELVEIAAEKLARHGARPARPDEARAMLGLRPA
jgi:3-keto-5-aminohexanoate cleavage enzyme